MVDYKILCRYCQNCTSYQNKYGVDSEQYKEWYQTHAQSCPINYTGSSNAMEMEGAKRIWSCSVDKNNMRYVRMLGDGDSEAYKDVLELNPYNVDIEREECNNHAHKRIGTALRNISKSSKLEERYWYAAPNDTAYKWWSCHSRQELLCKLCRTLPPPAMGARFTVFGHAGHADPLDGWRCCSQKRVMSRPIQVRQH